MRKRELNSNLDTKVVGGKALNLIKLREANFTVPPFTVVTNDTFCALIPLALQNAERPNELEVFLEDLDISNEIFALVDELIENPKSKMFAVRSSALNEDGEKFSFAGQFESYLYVDYADIPKYVKQVWLSQYSERVLDYFRVNKISRKTGIAVLIQEMIDADVSGVGFGLNPNSGKKGTKVLSSVFGVGEGLVSGELNSDNYYIDGDHIDFEIATKEHKAVRSSSGHVKMCELEPDEKNANSLSKDQIIEISEILDQLNILYGVPQDIEFAIKDEKIHLLQSRPITAIFEGKSNHENKVNRIIWDNSNIIESYPGVTTPLTFSYILNAYRQVYAQLAQIFGVSAKKITQNSGTFEHMIGLVNGRVYYNLFSWYRMLSLFPGYKLNARFMENMMGVKERFDLPKEKSSSKTSAFFRTIWMGIRILGHMFSIKKQTKRYLKDVERTLEEYKRLDLEKMSAFQLMEKWKEFEAYLTSRWKAPILTDSFALYYFGKLQKMIERINISENSNLHNDLLCGSNDIISVEPIHRTIELAAIASEEPELKSLFDNNSTESILRSFSNGNHPEFYVMIKEYLDDFGDRCVGELKLETVSHKEDPTIYLGIIKSFVSQGIISRNSSSNIDVEVRVKAEQMVKSALRNKPLKRFLFARTLNKTRFLVSNRENLRYERTRVFGLTREMFAQIGKEFEKANILNSYRDVFYLTMEEMFHFIEGSSVDTDLKALTEMRKKEYLEYEQMEPPAERFTTYDAVNFGNDFFNTSIEETTEGDLKGVGCCPGIIKAKVQVIKHPKDIEGLNGDILVTSSTDPGWVTLFPTASAIVVERGSLLSHSAIVSREMGIPCIVGVTGLLKRLKTGDLIEMNGSTGRIKIIQNEQ